MSDRYYTKLICKKCGEELEQDMPLFVPVGEKVTIKCPKCKTKTQFWIELISHSKIVK